MVLEVNVGNLIESEPNNSSVIFIGQLPHIVKLGYQDVKAKLGNVVTEDRWKGGVDLLVSGKLDEVSLHYSSCTIATLPSKISRHNAPSRPFAITKITRVLPRDVKTYIVLVVERENVFPSVCAVARAFPTFSEKASYFDGLKKEDITIEVILAGKDKTPLGADNEKMLRNAVESIRLSARIVDMPCNMMDCEDFLAEIVKVGKALNITPMVIKGEELKEKGFGGIWGVGKAATVPPVFAVLSHTPAGATRNIAWVGKGIVYDTGGLSIKSKTGMPGMKKDCGGAAGILGAFSLAIKSGFTENLHAIFCLAENSVGPTATRPDDIHLMYSGRTVEINNTDAEGRLVLADGVAYAKEDLECDVIVDMATLTGAQAAATGKYHAGIVSNCGDMEHSTVLAGVACGDLTHPLPFSPELHFNEFASYVADMKNSVADRSNATSSCAGLFIYSHLGFDFPGKWLHIDMAAPVSLGERSTGYGVALLNTLFGHYSNNSLMKGYNIPPPQERRKEDDDEMTNDVPKKKSKLTV